ncbi:MAG: trigger factor [bacterium]
MSSNFKITKTERLPNAEALITGEITLSFLVSLRAEALKTLGQDAKFPGFRPGHIPEDVLVKNIGEMRILEETAEIALAREYENIIKETKFSVLGRPEISITKLAPSIPLEFRIKVYLEPEFDLPDYKKIAKEIKAEKPDVSNVDKEKEYKVLEKRRLAIIGALIAPIKVDVPEILIEVELDKMLGQFREDVGRSGVEWKQYLEQIKKKEEDIRNEWRDKAVDRVKAELVIAKIAEKEKIEPEKEIVEHEAKHLLEHYPEADLIRAKVYVYAHIRTQKVLEFLESQK